ncbi:SH3 domain-containing protein [Rhodalgimonas zhirmunskyi]|uniref:SH3 domain-containing protein n=1 Tax=Rhodalgimonas zhirmunskyi TaxID=2964767 RepID=A0AAJ1X6L1_9RHOB|nr:SH3 domain-containing protein [Rhodoalgimonas zhirmunskyi]MDQ2093577.1 SH3 domain-containing protein [Rhodoalgimonas zhirmunskyi]
MTRLTAIASVTALIALLLGLSAPLSAADGKTRGAVTNLPIPRFVSIKTDECNVRRGPSLSHRIDWVFKRKDMPVEITAEHGHWRRVRDRDGAGGWVHYSLLSGTRTVIVTGSVTGADEGQTGDAPASSEAAGAQTIDLYMRPDAQSQVVARLESGVVARLGECDPEWCKLRAGGYRGWTRKSMIWGVEPDEIRE